MTGVIVEVKAASALNRCAGEVAARIVWWASVATVPAAVVAARFGDYMTPKDAGILLVPGRIFTVHSEVMSVFMATLPEWGCIVCRKQPWLLKIDFCKNTLTLRDRKCLPDPRRSFIAHLSAF